MGETGQLTGGAAEEWDRLQGTQVELRAALQNAGSEDERVDLLRRLRQTRDAIDQLEHGLGTAAATAEAEGRAVPEKARRQRSALWLSLAGLVLLLGGLAIGFVSSQVLVDGSPSVTSTGGEDAISTEPAAEDGDSETSPGESTDAPATTPSVADPIVISDPIVVLRLHSYEFSVEALVADDQTAAAVEAAVAGTYGERGTSDITVDPAVSELEWADRLAYVIQNFPRLIDGSLLIGADGMILEGSAPNDETLQFLIDELSVDNGFPPLDTAGLEVTELESPTVEIEAMNGVVALEGMLPTEELRDGIVETAVDLYGADNVIDDIEIDDEVYALFDVARFPEVISVFSAGGDFEVKLLEGGFFGLLARGIDFEKDAAGLSHEAEHLLSGFPALINRTTIDITITGHTDSSGRAQSNKALSEARAQSVASYLGSQGVDSSRLIVVGKGESEPLAANSTEAGRARNRRVIITMGFDKD